MLETEADRISRTHKLQRNRQEEVTPVASHLPLPALLSHVLVAFTIEFDNEFEHQMPHRTATHGATTGSHDAPWLVSLVMWSNCMQFVGEEGVTVNELERLARTETNLNGMKRWGYIKIEPDTPASRSKRPRPDAVIRPTPAGRKAQEVWRPLFGVIEKRWQERFGQEEIDQLQKSLWAVASQFDVELSDCLPILGYGLFSTEQHPRDDRLQATRGEHERWPSTGREDGAGSHLPLLTLLSRVLLAFAIEFEGESDVSLAISTNILRVLNEQGVRIRDLPRLTGVSPEAISMALGILQKRDIVVVESDPAATRGKVARLTPKGREAQDASRQLISVIEEHWQARFGKDTIGALREILERVIGVPNAQQSPLSRGLEPYPDGWRASAHKPNTLPYYPMVLHRGGFPDGS